MPVLLWKSNLLLLDQPSKQMSLHRFLHLSRVSIRPRLLWMWLRKKDIHVRELSVASQEDDPPGADVHSVTLAFHLEKEFMSNLRRQYSTAYEEQRHDLQTSFQMFHEFLFVHLDLTVYESRNFIEKYHRALRLEIASEYLGPSWTVTQK